MIQKTKEIISYSLIIIGMALIIAKAVDYFVPGNSLIPGLTLIGILLAVLGAFLIKSGANPKAVSYAIPKNFKQGGYKVILKT